MENKYIIIKEYCIKSNIEMEFLSSLMEEGLIDIINIDGENYIKESQLSEIESYSRMYYDLSVNIEGIDIIHNLLEKIRYMQEEIKDLRERLVFYD